MILRNFVLLRAFTVCMENLLRFEISRRSIWAKWNLHRSEFHSTQSYVNAANEVTSYRSKILSQSEISNRVSCKRALCLLATVLSINENKNKMDLGLFKIGGYVNLGLFKTKRAICHMYWLSCLCSIRQEFPLKLLMKENVDGKKDHW